jgi:hypothetical protein
MAHKCYHENYGGELLGISTDESRSDIYVLEVEITG